MDDRKELIESWYKLSNLAKQHKAAGDIFHLLAEAYYDVEWHNMPALTDNDQIIDTIDYGTDSLTFTEFEELVRAALIEAKRKEMVSA